MLEKLEICLPCLKGSSVAQYIQCVYHCLFFHVLQTDRIPDIYKMPPPIKQDPDDHTDYRIPHPVPQPKTYFFISVRTSPS